MNDNLYKSVIEIRNLLSRTVGSQNNSIETCYRNNFFHQEEESELYIITISLRNNTPILKRLPTHIDKILSENQVIGSKTYLQGPRTLHIVFHLQTEQTK